MRKRQWAVMVGLLGGVAFAGAPRFFPLLETADIPVQPAQPELLGGGALCVRHVSGGLPKLEACPRAVDQLFSSKDGSVMVSSVPTGGPLLGVMVARPERFGVEAAPIYAATDAVVTRRSAWTFAPRSLDEQDLDALVGWCRAGEGDALVVQTAEGCGRAAVLSAFDVAEGGISTRDIGSALRDIGVGDLATEGARTPQCNQGQTKILAVRAVSVAAVCAEHVWPVALTRSREAAIAAAATPEAPPEAPRALWTGTARVDEALGRLQRATAGFDSTLAQAQLDLAVLRQQVEGGQESDQRFVALFTRFAEIESSIGETVVRSGSLAEQVNALRPSVEELRDKSGREWIPPSTVAGLESLVEELEARLLDLERERTEIDLAVAGIREGIGYVQGGLSVVQAPRKP